MSSFEIDSSMKMALRITALVLSANCVLFSQKDINHNRPVFYFGERQFYVGMPMRDAVAALSACCQLSPPLDSDIGTRPRVTDQAGHFVLQKEGSKMKQLGAIFFSGEKVVGLSYDVLPPEVDTSNEHLVAFARALKRALPEGPKPAIVSVKHGPGSDADFDVLTIVFADGQGIRLTIVTPDLPDSRNSRNFVSLEETLAPEPGPLMKPRNLD
jgi:hypothetical protein